MLYHHTVVIKEWHDIARDPLCRTTFNFYHDVISLECTDQSEQSKQSYCLILIQLYCVLRIHGHIFISKDIVSIFLATVRCRTIEEWTNRITTIAACSDNGSHNRFDLIQSLVPTHYICNGYYIRVYRSDNTKTVRHTTEYQYMYCFRLQRVLYLTKYKVKVCVEYFADICPTIKYQL